MRGEGERMERSVLVRFVLCKIAFFFSGSLFGRNKVNPTRNTLPSLWRWEQYKNNNNNNKKTHKTTKDKRSILSGRGDFYSRFFSFLFPTNSHPIWTRIYGKRSTRGRGTEVVNHSLYWTNPWMWGESRRAILNRVHTAESSTSLKGYGGWIALLFFLNV